MVRSSFLFVLLYLVIFAGCSHSVEPPTSLPPAKDPQNYTWTVDTLFFTPWPQAAGQTMIQDLYGVNDTLLYAVCYDAWAASGGLWKFDGKSWKTVVLGGGNPMPTPYQLFAIKGFSERDIYVFGNRSYNRDTGPSPRVELACAAHFNGAVWQEIPMLKGSRIFNVDHDSPSSIYCGGTNGELFSFDGSKWSLDTLKSPPLWNTWLDILVAGTTSDNAVLIQTKQNNPETGFDDYRFWKYKDKLLTPIDSSAMVCNWGGTSYWRSKEGTLFSCGVNGLFRLSGMKWTQVKGTSTMYYSVYGLNEKHMFVADRTSLLFYDGKNWTTLNTGINQPLFDAKIWCSQNGVFVAFTDGFKTFVLHGK